MVVLMDIKIYGSCTKPFENSPSQATVSTNNTYIDPLFQITAFAGH